MGKSYRYNEDEYEEVEYNKKREKFRRNNRKMKREQQETFIIDGERIHDENDEKNAYQKLKV